jgi:hypothetical protein
MKNRLMSLYDKIMLRKRSVIEIINDELKNICEVEHSRHRAVHNFVMNLISALLHIVSLIKNRLSALMWQNQQDKLLCLNNLYYVISGGGFSRHIPFHRVLPYAEIYKGFALESCKQLDCIF